MRSHEPANHPIYNSLSMGATRQFIFPVWEKRGGRSSGSVFPGMAPPADKNHNGQISANAAKKIRKAVDWLALAAQEKSIYVKEIDKTVTFKLAFVTLTLPCAQSQISDQAIKAKAFNLFLTTLRTKYLVKNYIWKAEAQANGNIHFHITLDKFVHWGDIRKTWNRCLKSLGYIEQYRASMREFHSKGFRLRSDLLPQWSKEDQHKAYMYGMQTNWCNPNTTDIHAVSKIKNLAAYLSKYFTKSDDTRRAITGRLWGMSQHLSKIIKARFEILDEVRDQFQSGFLTNPNIYKRNDYGTSIVAKATDFITHVGGTLGECYRKIIEFIQNPPPNLTVADVTF